MAAGLLYGLTTLNALMNAGAGVISKKQHDKIADLMDDLQLEMPESINRAEGIYQEQANIGLPGAEKMKEDVARMAPTTLEQAKDVIDSPVAMLGLLQKLNQQATDKTTSINIRDDAAKLENENRFASFLSRVKGPLEMRINEYENDMTLGAQKERAAGVAEIMQGFMNAGGSAYSGVGAVKEMEFSEDYLGMMKSFWDTQGGEKSAPATTTTGPQAGPQEGRSLPTVEEDFGWEMMPNSLSSNPYI